MMSEMILTLLTQLIGYPKYWYMYGDHFLIMYQIMPIKYLNITYCTSWPFIVRSGQHWSQIWQVCSSRVTKITIQYAQLVPQEYCMYRKTSNIRHTLVGNQMCTSFIPDKSTFTKYCLTWWISKFPGSFAIHWVRHYLVYFTDPTYLLA